MGVRIVSRFSVNRSCRAVIGINPSRTEIQQPAERGGSLVWVSGSHPAQIHLSTAYDWEICPDDDGYITLQAYLRREE